MNNLHERRPGDRRVVECGYRGGEVGLRCSRLVERAGEEGGVEGGEEYGGAAEGRGVDRGYEGGEEGWGEVEVLFGEMGQDLSL